MKIGLFGGSFDPVTMGHMHVADSLINQGLLDEVHFVPAYVSYFKKNYQATPEQRVEMLRIGIENSENPHKIKVNTFEIDNKLQTCTADFVEKYLTWVISERFHANDNTKMDEYYFITGADNAPKIPRFKQAKKLMELVDFVIVNRGNVRPKADDDQWYTKGNNIIANVTAEFADCSSTDIRNIMKNGKMTDIPENFFRDLVDHEVFEYAASNGIYIDENTK